MPGAGITRMALLASWSWWATVAGQARALLPLDWVAWTSATRAIREMTGRARDETPLSPS